MTGYEAFALYQALKLHFTVPSYDYFKYKGKVSVSIDAFDNRKDKYYFHKISRKYDKEEYIDFLVANLIETPNIWIGKLFDDEAEKRYIQFIKVNQSLSYVFENECRELFGGVDDPNDVIKTNGDHPILLKKVLRKEISLQTLVILDRILNFREMWRNKITDTVIWPEFEKKLNKVSSFMEFDLDKFKTILKKCL